MRGRKEETTVQKDFVERGHHQAWVTMINDVSKELAGVRVKKMGGGGKREGLQVPPWLPPNKEPTQLSHLTPRAKSPSIVNPMMIIISPSQRTHVAILSPSQRIRVTNPSDIKFCVWLCWSFVHGKANGKANGYNYFHPHKGQRLCLGLLTLCKCYCWDKRSWHNPHNPFPIGSLPLTQSIKHFLQSKAL